ncbi:MAG: hypothetical protein Q8N22_01860 [bacterium]|nr:hypothetical protein [bacterium]
MVKGNNYSGFKLVIGLILVFVAFSGGLLYSGNLFAIKLGWMSLLLTGFLIFILGWDGLLTLEILGKPMPFSRLEQNQVYQVMSKLPEIHAILICETEETERGTMINIFLGKFRLVEIPDSLAKDLEKGRKFMKVANTIAKLPPN